MISTGKEIFSERKPRSKALRKRKKSAYCSFSFKHYLLKKICSSIIILLLEKAPLKLFLKISFITTSLYELFS
jgi:hypothetical protein